MKILFVCHGNINRSAAAEVICRAKRPQDEARSAGVAAKEGAIMAPRMRDALSAFGYDETTRASKLTEEMIAWADVVFYMDDGNRQRIMDAYGEECVSKLRCLGELIERDKIPDPHFDSRAEACGEVVAMIELAVSRIVALDAVPVENFKISASDLVETSPDAKELADGVLKFAALLEDRMLAGYRRYENWIWARGLGVSNDAFTKITKMIQSAWKSYIHGETIKDQRDGARAMYMHVFKKAMLASKLDTALAAIDKIVKLDGLDAPAQVHMQIDGQITNVPREQFSGILQRIGTLMGSEAVKRLQTASSGAQPKIIDVVEQAEEKARSS